MGTRLRAAIAAAVAIVALAAATAADGSGLSRLVSGSSPGTGSGAVVPATIAIATGRPVGALSPLFWGVDGNVYYRLGPTVTDYVLSTPISLVRWPSGDLTDSYNMTANRVYGDNGTWYSPPTNESDFVRWCRSVHCHAIFGLPAEIDDPVAAAYDVTYTERTLGFFPDYWEIGNEPGAWHHFGLPWDLWNSSQNRNATPLGFARLVQQYVAAVHSVDPTARLIGLSGVGNGEYTERTWIRAVVGLNGPNLTAVGIHVYPAGHALAASGTLDQFYASLGSRGSIADRVPLDRQAIQAACPTCANLSLFVTEANAATVWGGPVRGTYGAFMAGFPEVPYLAAEVAQAIAQNATSLDLYALDSSYEGSLLNGSSQSPRPAGYLYAQLFPQLGREVLSSAISTAVGGVFAVATANGTGTDVRLLLVNTNTTAAAQFALSGSGFPSSAGWAWRWASNDTAPVLTEWSIAPSTYTLYPESVAILRGTGTSVLNGSVAPLIPSPPAGPVAPPSPGPSFAWPGVLSGSNPSPISTVAVLVAGIVIVAWASRASAERAPIGRRPVPGPSGAAPRRPETMERNRAPRRRASPRGPFARFSRGVARRASVFGRLRGRPSPLSVAASLRFAHDPVRRARNRPARRTIRRRFGG
jgi:hypothetical protein